MTETNGSVNPKTITDFWFQVIADDGAVESNVLKRWFSQDEAFDNEIRERFVSFIDKATTGDLKAWQVTATGRLALILLLDQFPRNIYRDDARAFSYDAYAVELALRAMEGPNGPMASSPR